MAAQIDVKNVDVYYGEHLAVHDVTMTIPERAITALIGPSGCGKSTVLRTLNRLHELVPGGRVVGQVLLDGADIYAPDVDPIEIRRAIGMVFQQPNPFPTMSVRDNVLAGLLLRGRHKKSGLDELAERTLRAVGMWDEVKDRLHAPGASLSGGQQQRLCIARAVVAKPEVLLMDEPCSALDPISTMAIEDLIIRLKSHYTVVIVTHNMQQAARISDWAAFFNLPEINGAGELVEIGDTLSLFTEPAHRTTENYISGYFG